MKIKYVGFYDLENSKSGRTCSLAAIKKMNYITSVLNRLDYDVEIVSPSWINNKDGKNEFKQRKIKLNEKVDITYCPSWITNNNFTKMVKILFTLFWLLSYLLKNTSKNEKILIYHSEWLAYPIMIAKLIKRFEVILEVEEIYSKVWNRKKYLIRMENSLLKLSDKYIFVSEELKKYLNMKSKKSLILYGAYTKVNIQGERNKKINQINLVYAGSIEEVRGGAFKSLDIIENLKGNYKLHILGGGSEEKVELLKHRISQINKVKNKEVCKYVGILHGEEFSEYLAGCDIALNPQIMGNYMQTAFPSKIITYLSHELIVISTPIKSIINSKVSDSIIFTNNDTASAFINSISLLKYKKSHNKNIIQMLDEEFERELSQLLH